MPTDLRTTLRELTAQPRTEHPYLSVFLDWTPDSTGKRQSPVILEKELDKIAVRLHAEGRDLSGFNADRQRIMDYAEDEAPVDARGLAIFACHAEKVWIPLALHVAVGTKIAVDHYPHTFALAKVLNDHETYAVVLADGQESRLFVVTLDGAQAVGHTEAAEEIKRFDAGGQAQMIFQRRVDNLIKAHTKDIAETLSKIIKRYDVRHVVIAGNDSIKGIILNTLPDAIKEKMVDYVHLDVDSNIPEIMEVIEPIMQQVERRHKDAIITDLEGQMASKGGLGALGVVDAAMALSKGQVRTLIMDQNFGGAGGECSHCGMLRVGHRAKCPYDGADLQPVDLRESFTARACQQDAAITIVTDSKYLNRHEGVGVLLRYRDDEQARAV
jgi:peptide subunit release factor 1 (eRF1)